MGIDFYLLKEGIEPKLLIEVKATFKLTESFRSLKLVLIVILLQFLNFFFHFSKQISASTVLNISGLEICVFLLNISELECCF